MYTKIQSNISKAFDFHELKSLNNSVIFNINGTQVERMIPARDAKGMKLSKSLREKSTIIRARAERTETNKLLLPALTEIEVLGKLPLHTNAWPRKGPAMFAIPSAKRSWFKDTLSRYSSCSANRLITEKQIMEDMRAILKAGNSITGRIDQTEHPSSDSKYSRLQNIE
jgi:hypothetical protein